MCQQQLGLEPGPSEGTCMRWGLGRPQGKKCASCMWASLWHTEAGEAGRGVDAHRTCHGPGRPWAPRFAHYANRPPRLGWVQAVSGGEICPATGL